MGWPLGWNRIDLPPKEVVRLYVEENKTVAEIAERFAVSPTPIGRILRREAVPLRIAKRRLGIHGGANNTAWRGGRRVRSDGYVIVWTPEGERLEHRVVMEDYIGRPLAANEIVHHIDENPSNNAIENLMLVGSQKEHMKAHFEARMAKQKADGGKICPGCVTFKRIALFHANACQPSGRSSWCADCENAVTARRKRERNSV